MSVTVLVFARLRDVVGAPEVVRHVSSPAAVADVWQAMVAEWPALAPYVNSLSCAVNARHARMTTAVGEGDAVAFLPPVSGG